MEIIIRVFLVHGMKVEDMNVKVNDKNYIIVRKKLEEQKRKIILTMKALHKKGLITTIYCPKNKKIQDKLDVLVQTKRAIKRSIEHIKANFT